MPNENRVFDVAKPGQGQAQATSKPVIVGHSPQISDPMVHGSASPAPTKIAVQDDNESMEHSDKPIYNPPESAAENSAPAVYDSPPAPADPLASSPKPAATIQPSAALDPKTEPEAPPPAHVEALKPSSTKRRHPFKWILILLIILLIVVYILLGAGVIKNNLDLPPFKKNSPPAAVPPATQSSAHQANQPSLPAGFSKYSLSGTNITFAAPTAWGTPASTNDPGYSKRGGTNQSDGVHAYIVD
ncbi:MAG TPA: hypothetical protein VFK97_00920, partial [Candidatus Saccharimonadales bacterium]|nr:hypothetical protein [Candidatus Saccharimonadales bacterium]